MNLDLGLLHYAIMVQKVPKKKKRDKFDTEIKIKSNFFLNFNDLGLLHYAIMVQKVPKKKKKRDKFDTEIKIKSNFF